MITAKKFASQEHIQVRKNLDFKLHDMPKYWFDNDPFKTRLVEAVSVAFPDGERYFIESVRAYRNKITDDTLKAAVKDFIMQEAQHGIAHTAMNDLLEKQGLPIAAQTAHIQGQLNYLIKNRSKQFNIAYTAGCEHMTAMLAKAFFQYKKTMQKAHPHMRAMFAWHAIEEMEHRSVCFDVMQDVAHVSYPTRAVTIVLASAVLIFYGLLRTDELLKTDGFSKLKRTKMMLAGINWLFGRKGVFTAVITDYLDYFRPNFHPDDHPMVHNYPVWITHYQKNADPLYAGQKFWEAAY